MLQQPSQILFFVVVKIETISDVTLTFYNHNNSNNSSNNYNSNSKRHATIAHSNSFSCNTCCRPLKTIISSIILAKIDQQQILNRWDEQKKKKNEKTAAVVGTNFKCVVVFYCFSFMGDIGFDFIYVAATRAAASTASSAEEEEDEEMLCYALLKSQPTTICRFKEWKR